MPGNVNKTPSLCLDSTFEYELEIDEFGGEDEMLFGNGAKDAPSNGDAPLKSAIKKSSMRFLTGPPPVPNGNGVAEAGRPPQQDLQIR
jgi:hypothetical protein